MLTVFRAVISVLLAAAISGCALAGNQRPPTLAQLGLADRYSLPAETQDGAAQDVARWWTLFDDPLLADLTPRGDSPAVRADIARTYVDLRLQQARIANARAHLAILHDIRDVARFRAEAKLVSERDALQIDAGSARIAATIPPLDAAITADAGRITALAGADPGAFREQLTSPAMIPTGPASVAIGAPSDLLGRREDLRAATARLAAGGWLRGPSEASLASYRRVMLGAQEDVERTLAVFEGARAREHDLADAVAKTESVATLARQQYRDGLADYDALSAADMALLSARDDLAEARAARARALIDLCLALGDSGEGNAPGGK
jgi:outer membrane protein TolC